MRRANKAAHFFITAQNGGNKIMWKTIRARFDSTDSYVSLILGLAVVLVIGITVVNYLKSKGVTLPAIPGTKQEEKTDKVTLPTDHTVAEGETLWTISEKYYQSGYNWVDVQKANTLANADYIEVGQVLTIPDVTPVPAPTGTISAASTEAKPKEKSYKVVAGDSLWTIAAAMYDNGYKWTDIATANNLVNPDLIYPDTVLTMPE